MRRRGPRSTLRRLGAIVGPAASLVLVGPPAHVASAGSDLLPDLRADRIIDLRIVRTSSGRKLMQPTTIILDCGVGPFEVRGHRSSTSQPFAVDQVVYRSEGTTPWHRCPMANAISRGVA